MFFLVKFLESVFPFLFNALKRSWDNLSTQQQQALVNAGTIGQFLKNNLNALGGDLVSAISTATALPTADVEATLIKLAGEFGLTTTDVNAAVAHLQTKLQAAASTSEWNGLLTTILNAGATILSGGAIDWVHVALGLGEWVYQQFVKPKSVPTLSVNTASQAVDTTMTDTAPNTPPAG